MALDMFECSSGSAIVLCTKVKEVADQCSPSKTRVHSLVDFYAKKILSLDLVNIHIPEDKARRHAIESILGRFNPNIHCMNIFLQALYRNPYRTSLELKDLYESIDPRRYFHSRMPQDPKVKFGAALGGRSLDRQSRAV
nr:unnamed protein product [Digitaria exilis]